ncbi:MULTISPECIES: PHP domain-containing protein [unclassified Microcoleus]|uniref:PHP domain-containing protein n=1 Tax=unclassified Microcoleus TaxID=2642155 RepID=UPI002FD74927
MTVNLAPCQDSSLKPEAQNISALKQVLQTIDADSCPGSYNFHMHTVYSDGRLHPDELLEKAIAIGLKGLAITDHHCTKGYAQAQIWLDNWKSNNPDSNITAPALWTGAEITAELLNNEVHILGYGFDPQHPSIKQYLRRDTGTESSDNYPAPKVIKGIQEAGGLAVLAHPCRYRSSADKLIPEAARLGIDGVEIYYAYGNPNPWKPSPKQTALVKELAETHGLLGTCGTDSHGLSLLVRI